MADMEAVDAAATQSVKRLREDEENELAEQNPEKKVRLLEEIDGAVKETLNVDVSEEDKLDDAAVEAEEKARPKQEEVEAEPQEQEEAGTGSMVDEEVETEVEPKVEAPVLSGDGKDSGQASEAKIGPKLFHSSMDMFNYFYELLRNWPLNLNLNKYEHLMLVDLINQGHSDPEKKKGTGIDAFQVQVNPDFHSRCFYIIRTDGSAEDFSYRKCVDNILPLPEEFKARSGDLRLGDKKKGGGGYRSHHDKQGKGGRGGGGHGGRRGGGHGRGNRGRRGRF